MDFFEAQARAKKRTSRLVLLFALAVLGTIAAGYFAAIVAFKQGSPRVRHYQTGSPYQFADADAVRTFGSWWDPKIFGVVTFGTLGVVGLASLFKWSQFRGGGSAVAESVNGRRVDPHTTEFAERRLLNVVEEMAIASGIPVPAVYVLDDEPAINAFAAGLTTSDAVVAVTRGTMEKLTRDELQGVIGHEFSHILNGDMRLNVRITAIVFGILVLGLIGRGVLNSLRFANSGSRNKNSGGIVVAIAIIGFILLLVGYVGYFFGRLIQAAVSRQREFLADASSVQFTRNPNAMTGALKKIGGYALGSSLQTNHSTAIGHFFFAQAFRSNFGGFWATHPSLPERIRAIDPQFDGKFFEPPTVVDIATEPFPGSSAARNQPPMLTGNPALAGFDGGRPSPAAKRIPFTPARAIVAAGQPTTQHFEQARQILAALPDRIRVATRPPAEAAALVYGLVLDPDPSARNAQQEMVSQLAGVEAAALLADLRPALSLLTEAARLPLLQLVYPALRQLDFAALQRFVLTLNKLVHADGKVSIFEFALQKMLIRHLELGDKPVAPVTQIFSFNAVVSEISVVLSALAWASSANDAAAAQSFVAGATQIKLIESKLGLLPRAQCEVLQLDSALNKLVTASGPIKQRLLTAASYVVEADGEVSVPEAELLRAVAAVLDVPLPPFISAETAPPPLDSGSLPRLTESSSHPNLPGCP